MYIRGSRIRHACICAKHFVFIDIRLEKGYLNPARPRQPANPFHRFENGEEDGVFAAGGGVFIRNSKDLWIIARYAGEMCCSHTQGIVIVWF